MILRKWKSRSLPVYLTKNPDGEPSGFFVGAMLQRLRLFRYEPPTSDKNKINYPQISLTIQSCHLNPDGYNKRYDEPKMLQRPEVKL
jgi:hypothetical protein